jgi:hypothetical protein
VWEQVATLSGTSMNEQKGQCVAVHNGRIAYSSGGFYATGDDWPARIVTIEFEEGVGWRQLAAFESDLQEQVNDLDLDGDVVAAVIWDYAGGGDGQNWRTVVADPETLEELSFVDPGGPGHGPRYQVSIGGDMVLYDATLDDASRIARLRVANDCDLNGSQDVCDRANYAGADLNEDGELDRCICPGNVNPHVDNTVDSADISEALFLYWGDDTGHADFDGDGLCDVRDLLIILEHWGDCPA